MRPIVAGHEPAHLEQGHVSAACVRDRPVPLRLAPSMEEVDSSPADPGEGLERLLQWARQLLLVGARLEDGAHVGGHLAIQMRVAEEPVDASRGVDEVRDQAAEGGKAGPWR